MAIQLKQDETPMDDHALDLMSRRGGDFVRQLARLYRLGDPVNRQILDKAFPHYFAEYTELAKKRPPRRETDDHRRMYD